MGGLQVSAAAVVDIGLARRGRVPRPGRQAVDPGERLAPRALELVLIEQLAEVGIGVDDADGVAPHRGVVPAAPMSAIDERIRRSHGPFVIDLSAVDFLDSSGIHCLVRARALLRRDDRVLAVVCPPGSVRRVLELTGIDQVVALYDSRDELARMLGPPRT